MASELIIAVAGIIAAILGVEKLRNPVFSYIKYHRTEILILIFLALILVVIFLVCKLQMVEELTQKKEELYELRITQLTEHLVIEKDKYMAAEKIISKLEIERDRLNEKITQSEIELDRLNKELVEMKRKGEQVDYLVQQIAEKKSKIRSLEQEKIKLSNDLEMSNKELKNSKECFFKLENDLAQLEQEIINNVPESENFIAKIDSLLKVVSGIKDESLTSKPSEAPIVDSTNQSLAQLQSSVNRQKPPKIHPPSLPKLRNQPSDLTYDGLTSMFKNHNFFDNKWNKQGRGFDNQFVLKIIKNDTIVIDHALGLMWQKGGSAEYVKHEEVQKWIEALNRKGYAGFTDWRLPTLEEAMSLMEQVRNDDMYIDPVFNKKQKHIWTSDIFKGESWACAVNFADGFCGTGLFTDDLCVRAVRSQK